MQQFLQSELSSSDKRKEWNNYSSIVVYHKYPAANPLLSKPEDQ
jgi:hypothetical protein